MSAADIQEIVRVLQEHPCPALYFELHMLTSQYRESLPVLQSLAPRLCEVKLFGILFIAGGPGRVVPYVEPDDAKAIASLPRNGSEKLEIALKEIIFSEGESSDILCQGVTLSRIRRLCWDDVCVNPASLANALTASSIRALELKDLYGDSMVHQETFLTALARGPPSQSLEKLEMKEFLRRRHRDYEHPVQALASVAKAVGECKRLQSLSFPYLISENGILDKALASCISVQGSCRREMVLEYVGQKSYTRDPWGKVKLPMVIKAMQGNYFLSNVSLLPILIRQERGFWHRDTRSWVKSLIRLNRAGRSYLAHDASNKREGVKVLSQINDEMDCIFIHLRENPSLCKC
jgi:hypothetical protein